MAVPKDRCINLGRIPVNLEENMHLYLTQEGLEAIAANYRAQAAGAENFNAIRMAEGAAMAIEHLIRECYMAPSETQPETAETS